MFAALPALGCVSAVDTGVATHALAMALALIRALPTHNRAVRAGRWHYLEGGVLRRPATLTLGILGMDRIGRHLTRLAGPCFGAVIGHDPYLAADAWPQAVERCALETVCERAEVLSLHLALTAATRNLINDRA